MIKLVCFDLDGTLADLKDCHKMALNEAIRLVAPEFVISDDDHLKIFDGKKTTEKLAILNKRGLPESLNQVIWDKKQELTSFYLNEIQRSDKLIEIFDELPVYVACCSNSIRKTVEIVLDNLGVLEYTDLILSNEDCKSSKPHPEIYWRAMMHFGVLPEETLVLEDAPVGILSATQAGCKVMRVKNPFSYSLKDINKYLNMNNNKKTVWKDEKMNVVIPMSGLGSRFIEKNYSFPKPLIEFHGKPMISHVVDCLGIEAQFTFIVRKEHREKYSLDSFLNLISPGCNIIEVAETTDGAARTVLLAESIINNDNPMFLLNSDQMIEWNSLDFFYQMQEQKTDGAILTFPGFHVKWSFAKVEDGFVTEVAEKRVISDIATCGLYYFARGSDFVKGAKQMIEKDIRTNGEFYCCPVFNELIEMGLKIKAYPVDKMIPLGTPEDLEEYLRCS